MVIDFVINDEKNPIRTCTFLIRYNYIIWVKKSK